MHGLQTCCPTYLFSKSWFMILRHFRVRSQESWSKWRACSWLGHLFIPALFHLACKELYAHLHHTLIYFFQTLFRWLPQQLLLGHLSPKLPYTNVMGYPEGTCTEKKILQDACYLDLGPGKESLCFYVGMLLGPMDWLPWPMKKTQWRRARIVSSKCGV